MTERRSRPEKRRADEGKGRTERDFPGTSHVAIRDEGVRPLRYDLLPRVKEVPGKRSVGMYL